MAQADGEPSPVTYRYEIQTNRFGMRQVRLVDGDTAEQGRAAYMRLWVGPEAEASEGLGDTAKSQVLVDAKDVLAWHKQIGATSRRYVRPDSDGNQAVHPTFALKAAWPSMMQAGMHPEANIDFLKVVHSGQTMRFGVAIQAGDKLKAFSRISRIEELPYGREVTIVSRVVNGEKELAAEFETKFLSRVSNQEEGVIFEQDIRQHLVPSAPRLEVEPLEVYRREGIVLNRSDITGLRNRCPMAAHQ